MMLSQATKRLLPRTTSFARIASFSTSTQSQAQSQPQSQPNQKRCDTCRNENCTPGKHCMLGWTTTPEGKTTKLLPAIENTIFQVADQVMMHTYAKPPIIFTSGEGSYMYDSQGNRYLDFTAGIAVNALGHSDKAWANVIAKQARKLTHTSNLYYNEPSILLARELIAKSQFDKVFFSNSGTEANEAALKFARKWARHTHVDRGKKETGEFTKTKYIAFEHGFSGRSMGALSLTHKKKYREPYLPLIPGVSFAKFNDIESVRALIDDDTCAVLIEPIQGEGGIHPADVSFLREVRELCNKHRCLLIVDEVQCGLGRTGELWAHERYGIRPDMMTLAKPLAGGLPIGAVLVTDQVSAAIGVGEHGTTFGGGPLACAVASHVLERISDPKFLQQVRDNGNFMLEHIRDLAANSEGKITEIRGSGLFIGVEFKHPVKKLIADAQDQGLLLVNAGENILRMCPPLTISKEEIKECMTKLQKLIPKMLES